MNYNVLIKHLKEIQSQIKEDCFADLTGETKKHACGMIPDGVFQEVIGIPDLHADFRLLLIHLIYVTGLVDMLPDGKLHWKREKVAVVINGDFVDGYRGSVYERKEKSRRGEWVGEEHYLVVLMNYLDLLARKKKSRLFKLLGNHEMLNLIGQMNHVSQMGLDFYGGETKRQESFINGEMNAHLRACGSYAILQIGSLVFVHAGVLPQLIQKVTQQSSSCFIPFANQMLQQALVTSPSTWNSDIHSLFLASDSLFWTREYAATETNPDQLDITKVKQVFQLLGMSEEMQKRATMCVGHTPQVYRCLADISIGKTTCESAGYVLSKCLFQDEYKTVWGMPFVRDPKRLNFYTMTFGCVEHDHPLLCFMDTAQSSAFDSSVDHQKDSSGKWFHEARRPCAVRITFNSKQVPQFVIIQSNFR